MSKIIIAFIFLVAIGWATEEYHTNE